MCACAPTRKRSNEVVGVGGRGGRFNLGISGARFPVGDVGPDGRREQGRLLAHNAHLCHSVVLSRMPPYYDILAVR